MRKLRGPSTPQGAPSAPEGAPPRTVAFLPVPASPCITEPSVNGLGFSPQRARSSSGSRFYDVVAELTAEYDRTLVARRELQVENSRLLLEVERLQTSAHGEGYCHCSPSLSSAPRPQPPSQRGGLAPPSRPPSVVATDTNGSGEVRFCVGLNGINGGCDVQPLLPLSAAEVAARFAEGNKPLGKEAEEEAARRRWSQGLPPEPQCPASPRPPPESPRGGSHDYVTVVDSFVQPASKERSTSKQSDDAEDYGRMSNMSLHSVHSQESRMSCESDEFEHHETSEELELLGFWCAMEGDGEAMKGTGSMLRDRRTLSMSDPFRHRGISEASAFGLGRLIMSPSGRVAVMWDFFTIIVLLYDLVVIPLQAYPLPETEFWASMELLATVTWTCDIILSFFKGFEIRGNIEMRPWQIAKHYLRGWFVFDISIVGMDWVLYVFQEGDLVDWLRFSRVRRALRLLRLARLLKHGQRFVAVFSIIQSENWLVIFRILWLLTMLVAINHFVSCGWYAIGTLEFDRAWGRKAFDEELHTFAYRYLTSFHWSVTQFTPASMEIVPTNALERVYNICIIFFGMLMFSCFVSSMTNSMTYLTKINYDKRQRQNIARSYIVAKGVPLELANDIMRHVVVNQSRKRGLREDDVGAFRDIPKRLIEQLRVEVHKSALGGHALFGHIQREDHLAFARLCQQAVVERPLLAGEELFHVGEKGKYMYFIVRGSLTYSLGVTGDIMPPVDVGVKQWLCEACLWVVWEHKGRAVCASPACDVTELDVAEFHTIVSRSGLYWDMQKYAQAWAKAAAMESGGAEHVTDSWGQRLRVSDLVQKTFGIDNENEAQRMVRIMGGGGYTVEFVFKVWVKFVAIEKEEKRKNNPNSDLPGRCRRRASFVGGDKKANKKKKRRGSSDQA